MALVGAADRCRCWSRSGWSSARRKRREPAGSTAFRAARAGARLWLSCTCRSRCSSPIRSTPRGWSTIWGGLSTALVRRAARRRQVPRRGADQPRNRRDGGEPRAGARHLRRARDRTASPGFAGASLFGFMLMAPLVVPEVILGLSLLLLFVAAQAWLGWPASRGIVTVTIAHATFGACFVAVLVRAQLAGFDRSLEEAALDLGARPFAVLWRDHPAGDQPGLGLGLAAGLHPVARRSGRRQLCLRARRRRPCRWRSIRACASASRPRSTRWRRCFSRVVFALVALAFWLIARQERRRVRSSRIADGLRAAAAMSGNEHHQAQDRRGGQRPPRDQPAVRIASARWQC